MLKGLYNECSFYLDISPVDPILIKSGIATVSGPDMAFVETYRNGKREVFLPGSSLKGVLRSHAEAIARTLNGQSACMPFVDVKKQDDTKQLNAFGNHYVDIFCGNKFKWREEQLEKEKDKKREKKLAAKEVYKDSCPICKLFGSTYFTGRLSIGDAYIYNSNPVKSQRDGVGIDRFTGGASKGAKFDLQVVTGGTFRSFFYVRNFELWQLGLLAFLVRDFQESLIWIGSGTSRGLGRVKGEVKEIKISYIGQKNTPVFKAGKGEIWGIGRTMDSNGGESYGYHHDDRSELSFQTDKPAEFVTRGIRNSLIFANEVLEELWEKLGIKWVDYIGRYHYPKTMIITGQ